MLGVHSAESVPFAGRFAVRDLVDGLRLRRGSGEDKHDKVAQHTRAVEAAFGCSSRRSQSQADLKFFQQVLVLRQVSVPRGLSTPVAMRIARQTCIDLAI